MSHSLPSPSSCCNLCSGATVTIVDTTSNESFGAVDPVAAPADPTNIAKYLNTTTNTWWVWNPVTLSWS